MYCMFIPILVMAAFFAQLCGEEGQLPLEAQKVLVALDNTIVSAKEKTAQNLAKIALDLGKRGDLDGALLVKKEAERLAEEVRVARPLDVLGNPINGRQANGLSAEGTWALKSETGSWDWIFANNGTVSCPRWAASGTWVQDGNKVTVTWSSGASGVEYLDLTSATTASVTLTYGRRGTAIKK